jgi:hypothetical protein
VSKQQQRTHSTQHTTARKQSWLWLPAMHVALSTRGLPPGLLIMQQGIHRVSTHALLLGCLIIVHMGQTELPILPRSGLATMHLPKPPGYDATMICR